LTQCSLENVRGHATSSGALTVIEMIRYAFQYGCIGSDVAHDSLGRQYKHPGLMSSTPQRGRGCSQGPALAFPKQRRVFWEALGAISTALTFLVIAVTAIVSVHQLRQLRGQRQDVAAVELVKSLQDEGFVRACRVVLSLSEEMSAADISAKGSDFQEAALLLGFRFETLGVLVYREAVPFAVAEELVGGLVVGSWRRLKANIANKRESLGYPMYLEWFQWLAEQFEKRQRLDQLPAYLRVADWRPPGRAGGKPRDP